MPDEAQLVAQLDSPKDAERAAAAAELGRLRAVEHASELAARLSDSSALVRQRVVIALAECAGEDYLDAIAALLDDPVRDVRKSTVLALGKIRLPEAADRVAVAIDDREADVRATVVRVLADLDAKQHHDIIGRALVDPSEQVQWQAAVALRHLGTPEQLPRVLELLEAPSMPLKRQAHYALHVLARPDNADVLCSAMLEGSLDIVTASELSAEVRRAVGRKLVASMVGASPDQRARALWLVAQLGDLSHLSVLGQAATDPVARVRAAAIAGLHCLGGSIPDLRQRLLSPAAIERIAALKAAGARHLHREMLEKLSDVDPDAGVRDRAAAALDAWNARDHRVTERAPLRLVRHALDMVDASIHPDDAARSALETLGRKRRIHIPEAVVELLASAGAGEILANDDNLLPFDAWRTRTIKHTTPQSDRPLVGRVLELMESAHGASSYGVLLDESDDPVTLLHIHDGPMRGHMRCADSFSAFVAARAFDRPLACTLQGRGRAPDDEQLAALARTFTIEPRTRAWPSSFMLRFSDEHGRVRVVVDEARGAAGWTLSADSSVALSHVRAQLLSLGIATRVRFERPRTPH